VSNRDCFIDYLASSFPKLPANFIRIVEFRTSKIFKLAQ
jgi:hypothetical protein